MNTDNFFSVERLVEFGLNLGVAQQMVNSMNNALQNAYLPSTQVTHINGLQAASQQLSFYVVLDGKPAGPFSELELTRLVFDGRITKNTYVWRAGMPRWDFAENVPAFLKIIALTPPPLPAPPAPPSNPT